MVASATCSAVNAAEGCGDGRGVQLRRLITCSSRQRRCATGVVPHGRARRRRYRLVQGRLSVEAGREGAAGTWQRGPTPLLPSGPMCNGSLPVPESHSCRHVADRARSQPDIAVALHIT